MNFTAWLRQIQKKPYHTRVRILWSIVASSTVILLTILIISIKHQIRGLDTTNLLPPINPEVRSAETAVNYITIERVEQSSASLKIYFTVKNNTEDILNFASADDIKLTTNNQSVAPLKVWDRQNRPFVRKVLSKTTNFGILIFPKADVNSATIIFDQLYFEKQPENLFKESLNLNFDELKIKQELRN